MKKKLRNLIAEGKIKQVLSELLHLTISNEDLQQETIVQSARYEQYEKSVRQGVSSQDENNITLAKITTALLQIIKKLPDGASAASATSKSNKGPTLVLLLLTLVVLVTLGWFSFNKLKEGQAEADNAEKVSQISGMVFSEDGKQVAEAIILVKGKETMRLATDKEGRFSFELKGFEKEVLEIELKKENYIPLSKALIVDFIQTELPIQLDTFFLKLVQTTSDSTPLAAKAKQTAPGKSASTKRAKTPAKKEICEGVTDATFIRASSSSTSSRPDIAEKKAMMNAKQLLSSQIKELIESESSQELLIKEAAGTEKVTSSLSEKTATQLSSTLTQSSLTCKKEVKQEDGKYRVYVTLEIDRRKLK